ncbi:MAG: hypothetical protein CMJ76_11545 [Planctomycetaceae bacterium]|nr:hypothetical protein [Planctomycetaceae bacterium]
MKSILILTACIFFINNTNAADYPVRRQITAGMANPESSYYDAESGFLFLSHVNGPGKEKDGNGYISKITLKGKTVKEKWFTGLDAPKGLRSHDGTLWISDIDTVVAVDIATGKEVSRHVIKDAGFLNDLATDSNGVVYISDMLNSRIYQIKAEQVSIFAEGPHLEHPNGLLAVGNKLYCGGWGTDLDPATFTTKELGRFFYIDIETKEKHLITEKPTGHLDGIEIDGKGGFFLTDWIAGTVMHICSHGNVTEIMKYEKGSADLAYLPRKKLLILPHMNDNTLTAFRVVPKH